VTKYKVCRCCCCTVRGLSVAGCLGCWALWVGCTSRGAGDQLQGGVLLSVLGWCCVGVVLWDCWFLGLLLLTSFLRSAVRSNTNLLGCCTPQGAGDQVQGGDGCCWESV
jgi:hypothetical protein